MKRNKELKMFTKYSSLENHYRNNFTEKCFLNFGHVEWVALEKIHGSNFSWWCDGFEVKCAKRSGFIPDGENFYNHKSIFDKYEAVIWDIQRAIAKKEGNKNITVAVYGEIYGPGVQKGIYYADSVDFIMFDILITDGLMKVYLPWDEVKELSNEFSMPIVSEIARGKFHDVLETSNEFDSILGGKKDNIAEGFVMKPITSNSYLPSGERAAIKSKNATWSEKEKIKKIKVPVVLSEDQQNLVDGISSYITNNRLKNVLSKIGAVTNKDFGKISGLLLQDAQEDYKKDNDMSKDQWKSVKKHVGRVSVELVRANFIDIIDGKF